MQMTFIYNNYLNTVFIYIEPDVTDVERDFDIV